MVKLDALGRATFHHIASHEAVRPTNRETRWLAHTERHGPLSSAALLDLTMDTHRCRDTGLRALQRLRAGGYLTLPIQQRAIERAEFHPYVYDISVRGRHWLRDQGAVEESVRPTGHWWHAYTTASLTAAIERAGGARSVTYVPARKILDIRGVPLGIPCRGGSIIPDQIFALNYGGSFRAFVLEVDRGTEPITSKAGRESLARKITSYAEIVADNLHHRHYGLKSPLAVLFTFLSRARADHFQKLVATMAPVLSGAVMVQVLNRNDPMMLNAQVAVALPWQRLSGGTFDIFKA